LFDGPGIRVAEFRCRAERQGRGPEEHNLTHSIVFVRRGLFVRERLREQVIADANQILFFNAGQPYHIAHPLRGGDDCTILEVPPALALELVAHHCPGPSPRPEAPFAIGHAPCSTRARLLHYELLASIRARARRLALDELLVELASEAVRAGCGAARPAPAVRASQKDLAEAAVLELNERLAAPPTLAELAGGLGCSPFHLSRSFHHATGMTLRRYLMRLRTAAAAERLLDGERDLTALALDLGFADHSHLTHAFAGAWGMPPSRFRQRLRPTASQPSR
jgi:AraC-like DNA-binding protein